MAAKKKNKNKWVLPVIGGLAFLLMSMKKKGGGISKYYSIADVQRSETAEVENISQQFAPLPPEILENAKFYARNVLDPISDYLGYKYIPDSWYRSPALNQHLGGVSDSLHLRALGTDGHLPKPVEELRGVVKAIIAKKIPFHKVIISGTIENPKAVHVSLKRSNNANKIFYKDSAGNYSEVNKMRLGQILGLY